MKNAIFHNNLSASVTLVDRCNRRNGRKRLKQRLSVTPIYRVTTHVKACHKRNETGRLEPKYPATDVTDVKIVNKINTLQEW